MESSGSGKTQFLLTLLLSVQLPRPKGLGKRAIYISTETPLSTSRLSQLLRVHPHLSTLSRTAAPSLDKILSINAMDLETQDHILDYQLPVAVSRYDVGLVVIDSITANYRAERASDSVGALSVRSAELAKRGQMLRNLAVKKGIAIVVANQVSDRFNSFEGNNSNWTGSNNNHNEMREPAPPPAIATDDRPHSPAYNTLLQPPSSSNSSLPSSSPLPNLDDSDAPFDGSYLVSNPARNEILSLPHQQRFFTGWGDDPIPLPAPWPSSATTTASPLSSSPSCIPPRIQKPSSSSSLKTPALGFVWSTQIACRIALKKSEENVPIFNTAASADQDGGYGNGASAVSTTGARAAEHEQRQHKAGMDVPPAEVLKKRPSSSIDSGCDSGNDEDLEGEYTDRDDDSATSARKRRKKKKSKKENDEGGLSPQSQRQEATAAAAPQDRRVRRTLRLVFSPWTAGWASGDGHVHDEANFDIWEGGIRHCQ